MNDTRKPADNPDKSKADKEAALAAALRANLRRRKAPAGEGKKG